MRWRFLADRHLFMLAGDLLGGAFETPLYLAMFVSIYVALALLLRQPRCSRSRSG